MRMWMVPPQIMCTQHLLGEHRELHALVGILRTKPNLSWIGYVHHNCLEFRSIGRRHEELVVEMLLRGYQHLTPLQQPILPEHLEDISVDRLRSKTLLLDRCLQCRTRFENWCSKCLTFSNSVLYS